MKPPVYRSNGFGITRDGMHIATAENRGFRDLDLPARIAAALQLAEGTPTSELLALAARHVSPCALSQAALAAVATSDQVN